MHNLTLENQYFLHHLFYKCNSFTAEVESSVFGNAILELLLEQYSLDEIGSMDVEHLADFLQEKDRNCFADAESIAKSFRKRRVHLTDYLSALKTPLTFYWLLPLRPSAV